MSFVIAELITLIIVGIIALIGVGIIIGSIGISTLRELYTSKELVSRLLSILPLLGNLGLALIFFIIAGIVWVYLKIGLYGMASRSLRGKTKIETMFKFSKNMGPKGIFASIIIGIITFLLFTTLVGGLALIDIRGSVIGMIILLLIMILFSLVFPGIVVDKLGAMEAIGISFKIVKKHYFKFFSLLLFYGVVSFIISFFPIIGSLISVFVISPMMWISLISFYKGNKI